MKNSTPWIQFLNTIMPTPEQAAHFQSTMVSFHENLLGFGHEIARVLPKLSPEDIERVMERLAYESLRNSGPNRISFTPSDFSTPRTPQEEPAPEPEVPAIEVEDLSDDDLTPGKKTWN